MIPPDPAAAVERAVKIVRDAGLDPDSPAGVSVLGFLVPYLVGTEPPTDQGTPRGVPAVQSTAAPRDRSAPVVRLADWAGLEEERVADLVEFNEDGAQPTLPPRRLPRSKAKQQRLLAILKLAFERVALDQNEVDTRDIYRFCDAYGIADQNIAQNLTARGNYVTRRGPRNARTYRLTVQGLDAARAAFVELANGSDQVEI